MLDDGVEEGAERERGVEAASLSTPSEGEKEAEVNGARSSEFGMD